MNKLYLNLSSKNLLTGIDRTGTVLDLTSIHSGTNLPNLLRVNQLRQEGAEFTVILSADLSPQTGYIFPSIDNVLLTRNQIDLTGYEVFICQDDEVIIPLPEKYTPLCVGPKHHGDVDDPISFVEKRSFHEILGVNPEETLMLIVTINTPVNYALAVLGKTHTDDPFSSKVTVVCMQPDNFEDTAHQVAASVDKYDKAYSVYVSHDGVYLYQYDGAGIHGVPIELITEPLVLCPEVSGLFSYGENGK